MFEYELPDVGEGVAEGEVVAWHVEPGDHVTEDQVLAEIETDKAVVDLPAPVDGVIRELHAEAGDIVAVGSVVVTIDTDADAASEDAGKAADTDATEASTPEGRVFAPPHVRQLARELGVDITAVEGSGPSGRITEGDVRAAAEQVTEAPEAAATAEAGAADAAGGDQQAAAQNGETARKSATRHREPTADGVEPADRDRTLAVPATRRLAEELGVDIDEVPTEKTREGEAFVEPADVRAYAETQQATEAEAVAGDAATAATAGAETGTVAAEAGEGEPVTREPYRGIRRTIGQRMAESAYTAPHASHHDMAVVPGLVEARERLKPRAEEAGVHLTYMPFVMKAVAAVLPEYPAMNAQLDEDAEEIVYHNRYNIGVAVATDAGLMVPVVENVDRKGLLELAAEVNDLVERARSRDLAPEEFQGSTFTITNFGAIGGEYATPILNYPETAILGLGELKQRPVVDDGEVVAQHTLPLSVSIDHRVVDGADSANFCNDLKTHLADPIHLLL